MARTLRWRPGSPGMEVVAPHLDVAEDVLDLARWLCTAEEVSVSVLIPVRKGAPEWLAPAISDGLVFFSATPWLPSLRSIITTFGHLYMTSANLIGEPPTVTAAQAGKALGEDLLVLDCDSSRDPSVEHGSTTMVYVSRDGELAVTRPGINDRGFGGGPSAYEDALTRRWHTHCRQSAGR
jgi:hypothetical protein